MQVAENLNHPEWNRADATAEIQTHAEELKPAIRGRFFSGLVMPSERGQMNKSIEIQRGLGDRPCKLFGQLRISGARTTAVAAVAVSAAISMLVAALALPSEVKADDNEVRTFTVDVSTGFPYLQNDIDPAEGQDVFSPGDTFIQDGSIYPEGTIPTGKTDFDPNTPGAIGKYRVRGTFTTDLANFKRAAAHGTSAAPDLAFATEIFSLGDHRTIILTDGTWPNAYFSAHRVVLGGTGRFRDVVGEVHEENIGENKHGFCNLRVTFKLRKVGEGHGR